jgi:glycosyltransferase involved in cell wall biosynthesis
MKEFQLLSVVIPAYNERATLRTAVERLIQAELRLPVEILVVDDGSHDGTSETIKDHVESGRVSLLRHARNRGKAAAIRTGLDHATGDVFTILDADLEYDPNDYQDVLQPILDGEARVCYGTRSFRSHTAYSFWYVVGNRMLGIWASFLFNTWLTDVETCFKVAETSLWRSLRLHHHGFGIEAEATAKFMAAGERIYEVPISYRARTRAEGKKLRGADGLQALWILLKIRLGLD